MAAFLRVENDIQDQIVSTQISLSKEDKNQSVELNFEQTKSLKLMNNLSKVESSTQIIKLLNGRQTNKSESSSLILGSALQIGQLKSEKKFTIALPDIKMYPVSRVITENDRNDIDPLYRQSAVQLYRHQTRSLLIYCNHNSKVDCFVVSSQVNHNTSIQENIFTRVVMNINTSDKNVRANKKKENIKEGKKKKKGKKMPINYITNIWIQEI
ncbi:hypothetical protein RFI_28360 [Reticulomyxa filosa]|uniref:Uncharacterized protein n=1 Tax=Reticulomyxa filosa TaxID=46433 RepID=X6M6D9_RETFI|nr:hypothetical protein RFI_28360 [Reticulomyxa filosa]|eukprot:ETO09027.1 hypothetical protein RFI_28360 [Reticulomyxa filosa]